MKKLFITLRAKFTDTKKDGSPVFRAFKHPLFFDRLVNVLAFIMVFVGFLRYIEGFIPFHPRWDAFYTNIHTELIGIGITVLAINNLIKLAQNRSEKQRLVLQMGSPNNGFAVEAARQLLQRGWLFDGSLREARLYKADLTGVHLEKADLRQSNLMEAKLEGAILWLANLSDCALSMANLENSVLRGANLERANLSQTNLRGADISEAVLESAALWRSDMENIVGNSAQLQGASLFAANLTNARLYFADMTGANLKDADLNGAYLIGACLFQADLSGANLTNVAYSDQTVWTETKYTTGVNGTKWPEGFDPETVGAVMVMNDYL